MASVLAISVAEETLKGVTRFHPDQYRQFANLAEAFFHNATVNHDLVAYEQADSDRDLDGRARQYLPTDQCTTKQRVLKIAAQLEAWGIRPGDSVAILSLNRPEWTEAEMAVYTVGAVCVAIYVRVSEERLRHMLTDAQARCVVVENQQLCSSVLSALQYPDGKPGVGSGVEFILAIEDIEPPSDPIVGQIEVKSFRGVLQQSGDRTVQSFAYKNTNRDDLASVYYTSGSSGMPVGVPVTHGQVLENLHQIVAARLIDYRIYEGPDAPTVQPCVTLVLPERAHAFPARTTQLVATSPARARYSTIIDHHTSDVSDAYRESIRRDLREGAAGIVPIVPKVLVTIEQRVRERLARGGFAEWVARIVLQNATNKILEDSLGKSTWRTNVLYQILSKVRAAVTRKIRSRIVGPEFQFFVSGGAKMPIETAAFLRALGLPVYEGYGSTESNCPVATNTPESHRLGSVGKLFEGVESRIDPGSRELLLRGPNIASQYWHQPDAGRANWTSDGWYRTRDIARRDDDGFLYIEDRLDNILVLQNGENVSATAIEQRFANIPFVDTAVVLGHQRPVLVALIALHRDSIQSWAERTGRGPNRDLQNDSTVMDLLKREVERHVNSRAGHACERVRHLAIIDPLEIEKQTLTATEKVRRQEIERQYADLIERLYLNHEEWLPAFHCSGADERGSDTPTVASNESIED